MASPELAQRIADLFLEDWVGELAGSVRPRRATLPQSKPDLKPAPLRKPKQGKISPEVLAFVKSQNKMRVPELQAELLRRWGITLVSGTIYKIWNGWMPLKQAPPGSIRPRSSPCPPKPTAVTPSNGKTLTVVSPEILDFVRSHRCRVADLQKEIFCNWGTPLGASVIYKIWNGWSPTRGCVTKSLVGARLEVII
jgi:hypothetical protein